MAFLLGPILRGVRLSTRKEVISWLMPKMVFYMPTVASVTTTTGYFLASKMGLITLQTPVVYWISAVLIIVVTMVIQGLGILLPTNLRVYYELRKSEPDMARIQRLMRRYVKVVATQAKTSVCDNIHTGEFCYWILPQALNSRSINFLDPLIDDIINSFKLVQSQTEHLNT